MGNGKAWTPEEEKFIRENCAVMSKRELHSHLPGRTISSLHQYLLSRGLRAKISNVKVRRTGDVIQEHPWSADEVATLRQHAGQKAWSEIATLLNRSYRSVYGKAKFLGLAVPTRSPPKPWTKQELHRLMELSEKHNAKKIAEILGRARDTVRKQMERHDIKPRSGGWSVKTMSEETGYAKSQIVRAGRALGQKWRVSPRGKGSPYRKSNGAKVYIINEDQYDAIVEYLKNEDFHHTPLEQRFWPKVQKEGHPKGCWLWTGKAIQVTLRFGPRQLLQVRVQRAAWMLTKGEQLDTKDFIRSKCDTPNCVNPDHAYKLRAKTARFDPTSQVAA